MTVDVAGNSIFKQVKNSICLQLMQQSAFYMCNKQCALVFNGCG